MRIAKALLEAGLYNEDQITVKGVKTTPLELMHEILIKVPQGKENRLWAYGLVVEVYGKRDGRDVKVTLWNRHPPPERWGGKAAYYKNIGIPLSIGAQMIAKGEVVGTGVLPPETALGPDSFFKELAKRHIEIHEKIEEYHKLA
jgi:saccharopine dehydrogenase-like NADP-dependent oxidoreductase